jgi:hypothetical protein
MESNISEVSSVTDLIVTGGEGVPDLEEADAVDMLLNIELMLL